MIRKLAVLVLVLVNMQAYGCGHDHSDAMDIDTYSGDRPKSKLVFSIDLPKEEAWDDEEELREMLMNDETISVIENSGFSLIPGGFDLYGKSTNFLFVKGTDVLFVQCHYKFRSYHFPLEITESKHSEPDLPNRKIYGLSWGYIELCLRNREKRCHVSKYKEESIIKESIEKEGTITFINRIAVVATPDHRYSFYAIYDNYDELEKTENILRDVFSVVKHQKDRRLYLEGPERLLQHQYHI